MNMTLLPFLFSDSGKREVTEALKLVAEVAKVPQVVAEAVKVPKVSGMR
jgi:hypothetical protein